MSKKEEVNESHRGKLNDILSDENQNDSIYWKVFGDVELFHLLVGVCYLPSTAAHPDCWILTKLVEGEILNQNCCGFISFAFKIHRTLKTASAFKENNAENTYQSSMEYVYCTKTPDTYFTKERFNSNSLLDAVIVKNSTSSLFLTQPAIHKEKREQALSLPNLPIAVSLSPEYDAIFDNMYEHALQITSSNINSIFPGAFEIIFPQSQ